MLTSGIKLGYFQVDRRILTSLELNSEAVDQFIDTASSSYVPHHSEIILSTSALTHTPGQNFPSLPHITF